MDETTTVRREAVLARRMGFIVDSSGETGPGIANRGSVWKLVNET
jgi:hypothetical protein